MRSISEIHRPMGMPLNAQHSGGYFFFWTSNYGDD
ncbi:MAG: hypothetical protein JWM99_4475, partial [Verrucomicrobiales bacterium]|nr:hypothetical protein [Verrucomicrobiales bacterium]